MTQLVSKNPLVLKIVNGQATNEVLDLFFSNQLPFTDEENLECLVFLVGDEKHKEKSLAQLKEIPESVKSNYVAKTNANPKVGYYILLSALNSGSQPAIQKIIHNQIFPHEFLEKIAEKGNTTMLENLLENQIKLIAYPQIMEIMEKNPDCNNFIQGKIDEIREFYLTEQEPQAISDEGLIEDIQNISGASDESTDDLVEVEEDEKEKEALTQLQIINRMSVSERIKLALVGNQTQRMILIRDANKMVSIAVIESPKITTPEITAIIKNRSLASDIVTRISTNREWTKNYDIMHELVKNPKTPVKNALGFIKRLHLRDLQKVTTDKNVSPVIRNLAINFHREKTKQKK